MTEDRSLIPGVRWGAVVAHADERGSFRELWRARAFDDVGSALTGAREGQRAAFVQSNLSVSAAGVLRGLHLHRRQLDHWVVVGGTACIALVDVRPMLAGQARPIVETRIAPVNTSVSIPVGVAHGFLALEPLELTYFVTNEYDGSDELGFRWDDPDAAVPWPDMAPILSPRDAVAPSLSDLIASLVAVRA